MAKKKRHDVKTLKQGDKVIVYKIIDGKALPGEYVVTETRHSSATRGMGGMDEGSPQSWGANLRKLRGNEYHRRARVLKVDYDSWGPNHKYEFEKICKMRQIWLPI